MNFYVCMLFATLVVVCSASPIIDRSDVSPCSACNKDKEEVLRVKRTPDYNYYEKRSESHSMTHERHIVVTGNNLPMTFVWVGNGDGNTNMINT